MAEEGAAVVEYIQFPARLVPLPARLAEAADVSPRIVRLSHRRRWRNVSTFSAPRRGSVVVVSHKDTSQIDVHKACHEVQAGQEASGRRAVADLSEWSGEASPSEFNWRLHATEARIDAVDHVLNCKAR